jgi:hypothetical protein
MANWPGKSGAESDRKRKRKSRRVDRPCSTLDYYTVQIDRFVNNFSTFKRTAISESIYIIGYAKIKQVRGGSISFLKFYLSYTQQTTIGPGTNLEPCTY